MQPVEIVTQLRAAHAKGEKFAGINVKRLGIQFRRTEDMIGKASSTSLDAEEAASASAAWC